MTNPVEEVKKELNSKPIKKPWNLTILAIIAADILFCSLDAGSGLGVSYVTGFWYYGALVFLAGILPLVLWQFLFKNGWANDVQRIVAAVGGGFSVLSVVVISAAVGVARFLLNNPVWAEIGLAVTLTGFASLHALGLILYFYMDDQVKVRQEAVQRIGRAEAIMEKYDIERAVIERVDKAAGAIQDIESRYKELDRKYKDGGQGFTKGQ